jgi:hypothetical protein
MKRIVIHQVGNGNPPPPPTDTAPATKKPAKK